MNIERETQLGFDFQEPDQEVPNDMQPSLAASSAEKEKTFLQPEEVTVDIFGVTDAARRFREGNVEQPLGKLYIRRSPDNSNKLEFGYYCPTTIPNADTHRELPRKTEEKFELLFMGSFDSSGNKLPEERDEYWR